MIRTTSIDPSKKPLHTTPITFATALNLPEAQRQTVPLEAVKPKQTRWQRLRPVVEFLLTMVLAYLVTHEVERLASHYNAYCWFASYQLGVLGSFRALALVFHRAFKAARFDLLCLPLRIVTATVPFTENITMLEMVCVLALFEAITLSWLEARVHGVLYFKYKEFYLEAIPRLTHGFGLFCKAAKFIWHKTVDFLLGPQEKSD